MTDNFNFPRVELADVAEAETELIPLLSFEDEQQMNKEKIPETLPVLPLKNTVLFPGVAIPITVGRDKSIKLIKDAYRGDKIIGVVAQKTDSAEDPKMEDLHRVGTIAYIIKLLQMPDGSTTVIIQGKQRFVIDEVLQTEPYIKAKVSNYEEYKAIPKDKEFVALMGSLKDMAIQIVKLSPHLPSEAAFAIKNIESPSFLINFISSNMNTPVEEKQKTLEVADLRDRATLVLGHMTKELEMLTLKNQIQSKARVDMDKQQREYYLNQQMKAIQDELGVAGNDQQVKEMNARAEKKKWKKEVAEIFKKEMDKLKRMHPMASEHSIQINYLEVLLDLPWDEITEDKFDLKNAEKILNEDHFGLEKVKERIVEHLAVLKLKGNMKAPILCLYGPPGVGKTSLGKSIAKALGREYVRMSLGGLRDEAEIRGHRKTYIGAMPGRIIQNIKKAKTSNPVFVLDEIDKLARDYHGDPSSALLEVLDPEQNNSFHDNFVEIDYDLSKVLFIATANALNTIQPALLDRLEIIEISGYSTEEKIEIAKRHLLPKQLSEHGLTNKHLVLPTDKIEQIIEDYTRESGVRKLEKCIASVVRNVAKTVATREKKENEKIYPSQIQKKRITKILGVAHSKDKYQGNDVVGVVTGLAWTPFGGDILFIEVSLNKGKGKLTLTGNLGEVMKESAVIALDYLKANSSFLGIDNEIFEKWNVHIHVPEGATPKDGPSAGITILTALASAFTKQKVKPHLAMTGEITLRGRVLPVGGIKEKILAAKRAGIKELILSEDNRKDIEDIPKQYTDGLKFNYVKEMIEVVKMALLEEKVVM